MKILVLSLVIVAHAQFALAGETAAVMSCLMKIYPAYGYDNAAIACKGVKTEAETNAVLNCMKQVPWTFGAANAANVCQNVKN